MTNTRVAFPDFGFTQGRPRPFEVAAPVREKKSDVLRHGRFMEIYEISFSETGIQRLFGAQNKRNL